jgi:hypothetical protein
MQCEIDDKDNSSNDTMICIIDQSKTFFLKKKTSYFSRKRWKKEEFFRKIKFCRYFSKMSNMANEKGKAEEKKKEDGSSAYGKVARKGKLKLKSSKQSDGGKKRVDEKASEAMKDKTSEAVDQRAKSKSDRYCK